MRRLCALALIAALGAALVFSVVQAQQPVTPGWIDQNGKFQPIKQGTLGLPMNDQDRDRDFSTVQNLNFSGLTVGAGSIRDCTGGAKSTLQYGRGTLLLQWQISQAADTDSVAIAVYIYGTVSANSATRYLMSSLIYGSTAIDTVALGKSTVTGLNNMLKPLPTFFVTRNRYAGDVAAAQSTYSVGQGVLGLSANYSYAPNMIPTQLWKTQIFYNGLTGAIAIPLGDVGGNGFPFPYVYCTIANFHARRSLAAVSLDYWPRVQ